MKRKNESATSPNSWDMPTDIFARILENSHLKFIDIRDFFMPLEPKDGVESR